MVYKIRINLFINNIESYPLDSIINELNTGDLVFYRWDWWGNSKYNVLHTTVHNMLPTALMNSNFTHVGIVLKLNNIPYVYELTSSIHYDNLENMYKMNIPILTKAVDNIHKYSGTIFVSKYNNSVLLTDNQILQILTKYKDIKLSHSIIKQINAIIGSKHINVFPQKFTCSELICNILSELNIIDSCEFGQSVTPQEIYKKIQHSNNYSDIIGIDSIWHNKKYYLFNQ
jgi:hypothetical protein